MTYILPFLALWLVIGLFAGEMLIESALHIMQELSIDDNLAAALILFTLAALLGLPWLIWRAIDEVIHSTFRR